MAHLKDFTSSLMERPSIDPTMERWIYETKEMQRDMSVRIISLSRYYSRIPEESLPEYIDALSEALDDERLGSGFLKSEQLDKCLINFFDYLKIQDSPEKAEQARMLHDKVSAKFNLD